LTAWTDPPDDDEDDAPRCLLCLARPARPGSVYCGRLCWWLARLPRWVFR